VRAPNELEIGVQLKILFGSEYLLFAILQHRTIESTKLIWGAFVDKTDLVKEPSVILVAYATVESAVYTAVGSVMVSSFEKPNILNILGEFVHWILGATNIALKVAGFSVIGQPATGKDTVYA
jgi:hypothetical protein